jgi:hypothetical protein
MKRGHEQKPHILLFIPYFIIAKPVLLALAGTGRNGRLTHTR